MPKNLYDEDGNLIENAYLPDEVKAYEEEKTKAAEALAAKDKEIEETKARLAGLENKDFNFKKLREMTEQEKSKLSAQEIELRQRQEKLEEDQRSFSSNIRQTYLDDAIFAFAGDDKELKDKIKINFDSLNDPANTKEEITKKMKRAYLLTTEKSARVNPLNQAINYQGSGAPEGGKPKITGDLAGLAGKMGITDDEIKKYGK